MQIIKTMHLILLAFGLTLLHSAKASEKLTLSKVKREQLGVPLAKKYATALQHATNANLCALLIPAKDSGCLKKIVCCAIEEGHADILKFFLQQNKNIVDMRLTCGGTPLHIAAQSNQPAIAQMLVDAAAAQMPVDAHKKVNARADNKLTPLHYAAQYSGPEVIQVLLAAKANIEAEDVYGTTALRICTPQQLYDNAKCLISARANPRSALKSNNSTVLHSAAEHNNIALIRLLLAPEASRDYVHVAMNDGCTAFHRACLSGKEAACDVLLDAKSDVSALAKDNSTGLDLAALKGHEGMIKKLIKLLPEDMVKASNSALRAAIQGKHPRAVTLLLAASIDPNKEYDDDHSTALHLAAQQGNAAITRLLLDVRADVHAVMNNGNTPLTLAAYSGNIPTIKACIDAGAELKGSFAYRCAAIKGKHLAALYLLNETIPLFAKNDPTLTVMSHHINDIISDLCDLGDPLFIPQYQKTQARITGKNHTSPEEKSDSAPTQPVEIAAKPSIPAVTRSPEIVALNTRLEQASRKARNQQALQLAEEQQARIAAKRVQAKAGKTPKVAHKEVKLLKQEKPQQEQKQEPVAAVAKKPKFTLAERRKFKQAQALLKEQAKQRTKREEVINDMIERIYREEAEDHEAADEQERDLFQALDAERAQQEFWLEQNSATDGDGSPAGQ